MVNTSRHAHTYARTHKYAHTLSLSNGICSQAGHEAAALLARIRAAGADPLCAKTLAALADPLCGRTAAAGAAAAALVDRQGSFSSFSLDVNICLKYP
jgi:hypothetical protein